MHHISTTFSTTTPTTTYGVYPSSGPPHQDARRTELPSGQILLGTVPSVSLDGDGLLLTCTAELRSVTHADKGFVDVTRSLVASASSESTEDSDKIHETDGKSEMDPPPFDVISWYEKVVDCGPEPLLPLAPTPFEREA